MTLAASIELLQADTIQRASAGERAAIDELLRAMQRPFYNLALRMLGNRPAAEDATQESLLRVITHLSQYRAEAKFSTWATRVAVNAIFDFRSGLAREAHLTFDMFSGMLRAPEALFSKRVVRGQFSGAQGTELSAHHDPLNSHISPIQTVSSH